MIGFAPVDGTVPKSHDVVLEEQGFVISDLAPGPAQKRLALTLVIAIFAATGKRLRRMPVDATVLKRVT